VPLIFDKSSENSLVQQNIGDGNIDLVGVKNLF